METLREPVTLISQIEDGFTSANNFSNTEIQNQ